MTLSPTRTLPRPDPRASPARTSGRRIAAVGGAAAILTLCIGGSLAVGSSPIPLARVWELLLTPDASHESYVVNTLRLTRTVLGTLVGLSLAVSGAVMQAVTRNPLADPGLLGVSSGASLAIVVGASIGGLTSVASQFALASLGALLATALVYLVGSWGRDHSPVRLVLAGVAFSAAAGGVIQAMLITNPTAFESFRFWDVGALTRTDIPLSIVALPIAVGVVLVVSVSRGLSNTALGDDVAAALGTNIPLVRVVSLAAITLLCGTATAIAGPIGFVGLMVPLAAAWFVGPARGWIIAISAVAGPALVLLADILGRVLARPTELQVGLLTAFVGSPVLLAMVYRLRGDRR